MSYLLKYNSVNAKENFYNYICKCIIILIFVLMMILLFSLLYEINMIISHKLIIIVEEYSILININFVFVSC